MFFIIYLLKSFMDLIFVKINFEKLYNNLVCIIKISNNELVRLNVLKSNMYFKVIFYI